MEVVSFYPELRISIHAPAKGATDSPAFTTSSHQISIHAPAKGATGRKFRHKTSLQNFNPRSREGSDCLLDVPCEDFKNFNPRSREGSDGLLLTNWIACLISIHAPAKGATITLLSKNVNWQYFNPRSREGSDVYWGCLILKSLLFQSTLPRRERR